MNLRQAKVTQQEFQDKVRKLEKQLSQVQIKEAQAEAATALSSVAFKVGDLGDTMKTVEDVLQKRYEVSAGKARVARDMVDMDAIAGEGERAQGARTGGARRVPRQPGRAGDARRRRRHDVHAGHEGDGAEPVSDDLAAAVYAARQVRLVPARPRARRPSARGSCCATPAAERHGGRQDGGGRGRARGGRGQGRCPDAVAAGTGADQGQHRPDRDQRVRRATRASSPPTAGSSRPRTRCSSRISGSR